MVAKHLRDSSNLKVRQAVDALIEARVKYWAQWKVDAFYSPEERELMVKMVKRHYGDPIATANAMEGLVMRIERRWRDEVDAMKDGVA